MDLSGSGEDFPTLKMRRDHWNKRAALYGNDVRQAPVRAEALRVLLALLPTNISNVLDVGTGTGVTALAVSDKLPGVDVVCSDLSPDMLRHARSQPGSGHIRWVMAHSAHLPFRDGVFDVVTSTFTLHHVPPPEQLVVLRELRRVLAPCGRIVLADQILPSADIDKHDMNERVLDLFYAHLRRDFAASRLARFGEWSLTAEAVIALAWEAGLVAARHIVHPLVSVFVMHDNQGHGQPFVPSGSWPILT